MRRVPDPQITAALAAEPVEIRPDVLGPARGLVDYYLAEAARVEALAADTAPGAGRERFRQVAEEYRGLAAWVELTAGRRTIN